ncbi:MAG: NADP-dependent malic enzyme [Fimbriimonas sp.]|nr:NADP-dependent malic enzyme [Fimbriimonas sp.]
MASLNVDALAYHDLGRPGKIEVVPTKPCLTARDLSLAYTPGVASPCLAIEKDEHLAYRYTNRGNLVAVVSNGTAVLGLGDIGALAGKPVMEGKAVLFKRFAQVDVFDIELDTHDPAEIIRACQLLEPTFGGINLEDIKAPECFQIEEELKRTMSIPVFHDDQHGTAIISGAALLNALHLTGKPIDQIRIVVNGAGASALACAKFYVLLGVNQKNITLVDTKGVIHTGRTEGMNPYKAQFARETHLRTLEEALAGADMFLGCSVANLLTPEMLASMAPNPIIFALANPNPEITYEAAKAARPDAIVATGRSDFPNQVNNVLGFPFIFRGALDVRSSTINEEMKLAAAHALADLARQPVPDEVAMAYGGAHFEFGTDYIIPKPFDWRLLSYVSQAVARAACDTGVAREPIEDWEGYAARLDAMTNKTEILMRRIRSGARARNPRIVFAEGESSRVVDAARIVLQERTGRPILLGRHDVVEQLAKRLGVPLDEIEIVDPNNAPGVEELAQELIRVGARDGITPHKANKLIRTPIYFGMMQLRLRQADAMIVGAYDAYSDTLRTLLPLTETEPTVHRAAGFHVIMIEGQTYVIGDTVLTVDPTPEYLAEIALEGADFAREMGLLPKVALLSFSNFGGSHHPRAKKVRKAVEILHASHPDLICDGEMHGDVAVIPDAAQRNFPLSQIQGDANVLICPDLDSANIAYKLLASIGHRAESIGPVLKGLRMPVNMVSHNSSARDIAMLAAFSAYRCGPSTDRESATAPVR